MAPETSAAAYEAFFQAVHLNDREQVDQAYTTSLSQGHNACTVEYRILRADNGEIRYLRERYRHVTDTAGEVVRSIGVIQDITDRKKAELEREHTLEQGEANLRTTLHSIGDAVIAADTTGRITRMNPMAETLTGWSFTQTQGEPLSKVFDIVHAHTRTPVISPADQVLASGRAKTASRRCCLSFLTWFPFTIAI